MTIRVECYAGYRGDQEPLAFRLGGRRFAVRSVVIDGSLRCSAGSR